ncbi:hypothetical protein G9A89_008387 [Geosiphon pyriformis]|nr:hypothetical protein G9A89_008387 [Geosiphon pyriformis]
MTTNRAIVTNKVSTREGLFVIEAARQNVLATFLLKNISNKLPLAASGSFSSPLAGSSFPVKVPSKRHTWVSPSVVSTTSKSPKIFNNRPVNKLVFPALTTLTTTSTTTASQMATKVKNSKKQQQTVTTAMVTPNPFVVLDEIFGRIFTAAASSLPDMDGNSSGTSPKMGQNQPLAMLPDVVLSSRLSPIPVAKQSINPDDLKDWADQMEMESTVPSQFLVQLTLVLGRIATKVAIGDEVFLTSLKIAWSSEVASVSSPSLSVALCDVPLGTSSDDIKTALGIFGVVTSVKLKSAGLWQYAVVNFKDISSAVAALSNWFVLVRKDSVRILSIANQKEVIFSRDIFKAKLVNLPFGCIALEISDLVSQVGGHTCFILRSTESYQCQCCVKNWYLAWLSHLKLSSLPPKLPSNIFGGPKNFKPLFVGSKSYAKAAAFVVPPGAAAADMELDLGGFPETATLVLPTVPSVPNTVVESKLASIESHLNELFVLIKSLVEPVGALVALITKLLSTPSAMDVSVKECVDGLAGQNKGLAAVATVMQKKLTCFETISEQICLENESDVDDMVDDVNDNDDEDKDFSVYDNTFDVMMHL